MSARVRTCSLFLAMLASRGSATAQPAGKCEGVVFSEPPAESATVTVDRIEGQAMFAEVGGEHDLGGVNGACVQLFDRRDKRLLIAGATEDDGSFALPRPMPGAYVLTASLAPFHDIVVPLQVPDVPAHDGGAGVFLHMRLKEDRRDSFVTLIHDLALRRELLEMKRVDQDVRNELIRKGADSPDPEAESRMAAIDARNIKRVQEIVGHGWPGADRVGIDGAEAAWLLVQHAPHAIQEELFPLVEAAYHDGALSGQSYALLLDRIRVGDGKPQVYGSQAKGFDQWKGHEPTLEPIEDEEHVDQRRAEVGLGTLTEYREFLKEMYFPK